MKNLIIIITTIICTTILFGCNKTKTAVLPPATTTGANTFGCKVNGVVCATSQYNRNTGFGSGEGVSYLGWYSAQDSSIIFDATTLNPKFSFSFKFKFSGKSGTYYSKGESPYISEFNDFNNGNTSIGTNNSFKTDDNNVAKIEVTNFDLNNWIISGNFTMSATTANGSKVNITDGRFDIKKP
jgi:hypothetical protein